MRLNLALFLAALTLAPLAAQARPVVWLHVPDGATQRVESADLSFDEARGRIETADHAIAGTQGERQEYKARRRDARAERIIAHKDIPTARRELMKARHSGDQTDIAVHTHRYDDSLTAYDKSRGHVRWHNSLMGVSRADMRLARTEYAGKVADLEFEQSVLLYQHGYRYLYGPGSFQSQTERMDGKIAARKADLVQAQKLATDTEAEFLALKD